MKNLEKVLARLKRLPPAMKDNVGAKLEAEVKDLVAAQRRAAPVDPKSKNPGAFRDSIHEYPNPDRPLSFRVIADAVDEEGKPIGGNIEHGHRARDGTHVPGQPSFYPTYRARKKGMKSRTLASGRKALKQLYPKE
jgi:hypothetical protein